MYLIGALAAATPIILHLLHRRNPRPVPFSTLRFLRAATSKNRRSRRITQFLTMLLRILILLLIALAFARPKIRYAEWLPQGRRTALIVLDASASMRTRLDGRSRFVEAKNRAGQLIDGMEPGDRVALLAPGAAEPLVVFPALSDRRRVRDALADLECGYGRSDLAASLAGALQRLEYGKGMVGLEVHLFSDWQSVAWDEERANELSNQLKGQDVPIFLSHIESRGVKNAGISKVRFFPPAVIGQRQVTLEATIPATAAFAGENTVNAAVAGQERASRSFMMRPGDETTISLPVPITAEDGNSEAVTGVLSIGPDALVADNSYNFSLPRARAVPVLLVYGTEKRDTFFLQHAIQPGARPNTILAPRQVSWSDFLAGRTAEDDYRLVLISNPPALDSAAAARIERFLAEGTHVFIFPGGAGMLDEQLGKQEGHQ